jgi:hypothetical protein
VAIISTGSSSVAVAPTSNVARLTSGLSRITGGGLKPNQILDPEWADERLSRAKIAIAAARDAIRVVASRVAGPVVVLYFSGGYAEQSLRRTSPSSPRMPTARMPRSTPSIPVWSGVRYLHRVRGTSPHGRAIYAKLERVSTALRNQPADGWCQQRASSMPRWQISHSARTANTKDQSPEPVGRRPWTEGRGPTTTSTRPPR